RGGRGGSPRRRTGAGRARRTPRRPGPTPPPGRGAATRGGAGPARLRGCSSEGRLLAVRPPASVGPLAWNGLSRSAAVPAASPLMITEAGGPLLLRRNYEAPSGRVWRFGIVVLTLRVRGAPSSRGA